MCELSADVFIAILLKLPLGSHKAGPATFHPSAKIPTSTVLFEAAVAVAYACACDSPRAAEVAATQKYVAGAPLVEQAPTREDLLAAQLQDPGCPGSGPLSRQGRGSAA
ncbi:hypothetical protein AB1Y20_012297 [Prymnesium parvum]|uniref:Uncharacterized protein n=1 Tax=Prymnesium parvum TaxID=97485 RepID=A0AB34IR01_PRYPA